MLDDLLTVLLRAPDFPKLHATNGQGSSPTNS